MQTGQSVRSLGRSVKIIYGLAVLGTAFVRKPPTYSVDADAASTPWPTFGKTLQQNAGVVTEDLFFHRY